MTNKIDKIQMPDGQVLKLNGGSGLEVCDIGTALYIDETKGLRRYLNGQIVDINTNTQAFLNRLLEIKNTNPDYFTTEANWQAEALLNIDGCVYKFVLNYSGETVVSVRLPKYPDYVEINAGGTLPVVGNGMTLGLTDGTSVGSLRYRADYGEIGVGSQGYGIPIGTNISSYGGGTFLGTGIGISTDPTKSGIQTTLNQTKLKMRYFIQIATGSETENNIINDIELNNPYSLFDSKYSDHELNNLSWLKSSGQWNAKAVYPTAYDKLLKVYNGTETVEGLSVKLSTEDYTDYDFVINTADETFRLPLLDGSEDLLSYRYVDLELLASGSTYTAPANGWYQCACTGTAGSTFFELVNGSIVCSTASLTGGWARTSIPVKKGDVVTVFYGGTNFTKELFRFTYAQGNGSLYFYVGETVQNANLIDAGRIGEQLANKQDKCVHIIDTYINGSSGYRIWSDGYCEQWGLSSQVKYRTVTTVNLLKTFVNTNYNVSCNVRALEVEDYGSVGASAQPYTTSSIQIYHDKYGKYRDCDWKACGYLAEGEY